MSENIEIEIYSRRFATTPIQIVMRQIDAIEASTEAEQEHAESLRDQLRAAEKRILDATAAIGDLKRWVMHQTAGAIKTVKRNE